MMMAPAAFAHEIGDAAKKLGDASYDFANNAMKDITDPGVPACMKPLVNGADAEKAYKGFLEFKDVSLESLDTLFRHTI